MKTQSLRGNAISAAGLLGLGFGLMLVPASPAFADISDFSINGAATLGSNGLSATVTGTILCSVGEMAFISVTVTQIHAKQMANAAGSTQIFPCNGTILNWSVTVQSTNAVPMRTGPASASAIASGIDFSGRVFEKQSTSAEIKLRS